MEVPILKQGLYLIASIQAALSDVDLVHLRDALAEKVGKFRARGVIVDVTVLDVMDSFASRRKPWRSSKRYRVVRSTLASRAARDMFPDARETSRVTYSFSNVASTWSFAT